MQCRMPDYAAYRCCERCHYVFGVILFGIIRLSLYVQVGH
jgi:hypothetical protein